MRFKARKKRPWCRKKFLYNDVEDDYVPFRNNIRLVSILDSHRSQPPFFRLEVNGIFIVVVFVMCYIQKELSPQ